MSNLHVGDEVDRLPQDTLSERSEDVHCCRIAVDCSASYLGARSGCSVYGQWVCVAETRELTILKMISRSLTYPVIAHMNPIGRTKKALRANATGNTPAIREVSDTLYTHWMQESCWSLQPGVFAGNL